MSKGQVAQLFWRLSGAFQERFWYFIISYCKIFLHCVLEQFGHSTIVSLSLKISNKALQAETSEIWSPDGVNFLGSTRGGKGIPLWF